MKNVLVLIANVNSHVIQFFGNLLSNDFCNVETVHDGRALIADHRHRYANDERSRWASSARIGLGWAPPGRFLRETWDVTIGTYRKACGIIACS